MIALASLDRFLEQDLLRYYDGVVSMADVCSEVVCELGALDDISQRMVSDDDSCHRHNRVAHILPSTLDSNNRPEDDWKNLAVSMAALQSAYDRP